jgi:hypothetical protein
VHKYKYICNVSSTCLQLASITTGSNAILDTDSSHFSFAVYTIDPLEFAQALEDCLNASNDFNTYWDHQEIVLKASNPFDTIRIFRHCRALSITRGNIKVLFYADVGRLYGAASVIRKEVQKYNARLEKEAAAWAAED